MTTITVSKRSFRIIVICTLFALPLGVGPAYGREGASWSNRHSTAGISLHCPPPCNVTFEKVLHEQLSAITQEQGFVLRTEDEWCAFWEDVYSHIDPPPPCDTLGIDFDRQVALAYASGMKLNTCNDNEIVCVVGTSFPDDGLIKERVSGLNSMLVIVNEYVPGRDCICGQALVYPLDVVKVKKPVGNVVFQTRTVVGHCHDIYDQENWDPLGAERCCPPPWRYEGSYPVSESCWTVLCADELTGERVCLTPKLTIPVENGTKRIIFCHVDCPNYDEPFHPCLFGDSRIPLEAR